MRKPWNWQRCESLPARIPDCDMSVATLHKVFLAKVWGLVYFLDLEKARGVRPWPVESGGGHDSSPWKVAGEDCEIHIPPRCVEYESIDRLPKSR